MEFLVDSQACVHTWMLTVWRLFANLRSAQPDPASLPPLFHQDGWTLFLYLEAGSALQGLAKILYVRRVSAGTCAG